MKKIIGLLAGLGLGFVVNVHSAPITIDFEGQVIGNQPHGPLLIDNFLFTPESRMGVGLIPGSTTNHWLGFDKEPSVTNPNYPGLGFAANGGLVWVDLMGDPFSLLSLDPMGPVAPYTVASSNGGSFTLSPFGWPLPTQHFSGPEWTNVSWLEFRFPESAGGTYGFDNLRVDVSSTSVPEPGTAWLVGLGGLALFAVARRKRRSHLVSRSIALS